MDNRPSDTTCRKASAGGAIHSPNNSPARPERKYSRELESVDRLREKTRQLERQARQEGWSEERLRQEKRNAVGQVYEGLLARLDAIDAGQRRCPPPPAPASPSAASKTGQRQKVRVHIRPSSKAAHKADACPAAADSAPSPIAETPQHTERQDTVPQNPTFRKNLPILLGCACLLLAAAVIVFGALYFQASNRSETAEPALSSSEPPSSELDDTPIAQPPSESSDSQPAKETEDTPTVLTPRYIYNGEIMQFPVGTRVAPLKVNTTAQANGYYIVMVAENKDTLSFYVKGGKSAEIDVPTGTFEIWYATGTTWYGKEAKFGSETQYYKCDGTFRFYLDSDSRTYMGWELSLYPTFGGNLSIETVSPEDFPA